MNLQKLFEAQQVLDEHIMNEHPELRENDSNLDWKILALQVELGECANEWRGFKKWSKNQNPVTVVFISKKCERCNGTGEEPEVNTFHPCTDCYGTGVKGECSNPLLEEYVDCLHFILSIGLEKGFDNKEFEYLHEYNFGVYTETDTITQFQSVFRLIEEFLTYEYLDIYEELFLYFIGLGKHLDFTWEQVEEAYFEKNKENHARQESGY